MSGSTLRPNETDPQVIVSAIRQLFWGRSEAGGVVTLAVNATSTTVPAVNCGSSSGIFLFPQTADAAAGLATTYVGPADIKRGAFTIHHTSSAVADRSFWWIALG